MISRFCLPALTTLLLGGCTSGSTTPDGATIFDEEIALVRGARVDSAQREIAVDGKSLIVAIVDENLTDTRVKLEIAGAGAESRAIEVENNLDGAGTEIAAIEAPRGSHVLLTLTGPQNADKPGAVRLRVRRFEVSSGVAFRAWSAATDARFRVTAVSKSGLTDIARAITALDGPQGDGMLAAKARLIRANMLRYFELDARESRAEARRAAEKLTALGEAAALEAARARFLEALALSTLSQDRTSVNPTADEANQEARRMLAELNAAASPFGPIERARTIDALGNLDLNDSLLDEAARRFEEARALFQSVGHAAGEIEMRANLAEVLDEGGRRFESAQAYLPVIADIDRISNPHKRVFVLGNAASAQTTSGRTDEAAETLNKALILAREQELRGQEASILQDLGSLYSVRGDSLQASAFYAEALRISREEDNALELAYAAQSAGTMARREGDLAKAMALHKESVSRSTHVVLRMRGIRQLALDYVEAGDYPEAIAQLRASLASDLKDPNHHAYSDVKRDLAETLIAHGDGSKATLDEAAALLADTLRMSEKVNDRPGVIGAHRVNAMLLVRLGKPSAARVEYERAFALIFKYRQSSLNPELRSATLEQEQRAFRGYFDLVMTDVVARGPGVTRPASKIEENALRMLEIARKSHFGAAHATQIDAATAARIDVLMGQMAEKSLELATLLDKKPDDAGSTKIAALQLDMSALRAEVDRLRTAAAEKSKQAEAPSPVTAYQWRSIGPSAVQLSYALGNEHAYVWARSAAGTQVAMLSETPAAIERDLAALASLDAQKAADAIEQSLARLSSVLLPAEILGDSSNVLEVIAEGRIASVPFAGLRSPKDPSRRLVETHAITLITSMFATEQPPPPKQARPLRLVALASGGGTLRSAPVRDPAPKLQVATAEIRAVASLFEAGDRSAKIKLLTGADGTAEQLRGLWSSGADVVHFATHALADLRQPLASLLVLPANSAAGAPTYLTAGQVQDWRGDTDLVFLSACESAIGPPRFAGGMPGLQSAFLRAGARGVIATLWPIEDLLARDFSTDFYRHFTRGETAVQALSETQREWLAPKPGLSESEQLRRRITALSHAYFAG